MTVLTATQAPWQTSLHTSLKPHAHSLWRSQSWGKNSILQIQALWPLLAAERQVPADKEQVVIVLVPPPLLQAPPCLYKVIPKDFKGPVPFSPLFFSFFLSFGTQILKTRTYKKQLHLQEKLESGHTCPGKGTGSEKIWEDLKSTPRKDLWQRQPVQ